MEKSNIWFAISDIGEMHCMGYCKNFDQAEHEAEKWNINPIYLLDRETAEQWATALRQGLSR